MKARRPTRTWAIGDSTSSTFGKLFFLVSAEQLCLSPDPGMCLAISLEMDYRMEVY